MKRFPAASIATPTGLHIDAEVAAPVSPANVQLPFPATVEIVSFAASVPAATSVSVPGATRRMRWNDWSPISSPPIASKARPTGLHSPASVAGCPSRVWEHDQLGFPATVVIIPDARSTRRIRWLLVSAMKTFPAASSATFLGPFIDAEVAATPSPAKAHVPLPANVERIPVAGSTLRTRQFDVSAM
jgi:hypothetical protein